MINKTFYTQGAGNDFLISFFPSETPLKELIRLALDHDLNPDGYIICEIKNPLLLKFTFFNNDGSQVDFCGNALRAVGVCYKALSGHKVFQLETKVGVLEIKTKNNGEINAQMPTPIFQKKIKDALGLNASLVLAGVPHLVFNLEESPFKDLKDPLIRDFCKNIRNLNLKGLETYNLSFFKELKDSKDTVDGITYERGVEDFTLACGSGALSIAKALNKTNLQIKMPGGTLTVYVKENVYYMSGPAKIIETY